MEQSNKEILEAYNILESIVSSIRKFKEVTKRKIPIRYISERYGEYFLAKKLLDNGFKEVIVQKRGPDIIADDIRIEVKTSRWTKRFKKGKKGYGWIVPQKQWENDYFDFLVCVASDKTDENMLVFTRDEVVKGFSLSVSFKWEGQADKEMKNVKRLDIIEGGEGGLEKNFEIAREVIDWTGTISELERKVNRNPDYFFKNYGFGRLLKLLNNQSTTK